MEHKLQDLFNHVLMYEDVGLQSAARAHVPVEILEALAESEMEMLVLEKKIKSDDLCKKDLMLNHLTKWYREEFFVWFDAAECEKCNKKMDFTESLEPTAEEKQYGAGRVEGYSCSCGNTYRFPRYNHPGKLLETRKGRCGEWANCFTLICRALEYDARYVYDFTDHVWTEVYSVKQNRWLHCDTCEGGIDKPLMYESGWGKKLNYIIGFTKDEVQDVTWRYSSNHAGLISRRNKINEHKLVKLLLELTNRKQSGYTEERRFELANRRVLELCELLVERKPEDGELQGRQSGSLAWRLARGEVGKPKSVSMQNGHVWRVGESGSSQNTFTLTYDPVTNVYKSNCEEIRGWEKGTFSIDSISFKKENDWKMVYLARTEGSKHGKMVWKFATNSEISGFTKLHAQIPVTVFQSGKGLLRVLNGVEEVFVKELSSSFTDLSLSLQNCHELAIELELFGGNGDCAWQHTQVCRRSLNEKSDSGILSIVLQME